MQRIRETTITLDINKKMKRKYYYQCFITTLKPENLKLVAEHLRHWPFVKMYFYLNDKAIAVVTNLGKSADYKGSLSMFEVSRVIIGQCLKQYDVDISCWSKVKLSHIRYTPDLYLRSDRDIIPMSHYIKDLNY